MPEGNEVHRWAQRHTDAFAGRKMHVEGPNGRFQEAGALEGRKLERVIAVGKHLGYDFGKDRMLHVHLGRYGDWTEGQMPLVEVRGMLRLRMWKVGAKAVKDAARSAVRHYTADDGRGRDRAGGGGLGWSCGVRRTAAYTRRRSGRGCWSGWGRTR